MKQRGVPTGIVWKEPFFPEGRAIAITVAEAPIRAIKVRLLSSVVIVSLFEEIR
jgi:hypothetical protein